MPSLLVTESIALKAVAELEKKDEGRLRRRFPSFFSCGTEENGGTEELCGTSGTQDGEIRPSDAYRTAMARMDTALSILQGIPGTIVMRAGEGGIFSALWNLAEEAGCGLEIDALSIPILQETVEICEFCDLDPYYAQSEGTLLALCPDAYEAAWKLRENGIPAYPVGIATDAKRRVLHFGDRVRFLDRPRPDET